VLAVAADDEGQAAARQEQVADEVGTKEAGRPRDEEILGGS
jgi:hypothetical protein